MKCSENDWVKAKKICIVDYVEEHIKPRGRLKVMLKEVVEKHV